MIKAVLFDAGGVLHITNTAVGEDLKTELGLNDEQLDRLFTHYVPLLGTGKLTEQQVWDSVSQEFHIRRVLAEEGLFTRKFTTTLQKMPGMYDLVDELKTKGIKVVVFTNVSPQWAEVLEQEGHYKPFDYKVLSYEVGYWKPDPRFYQHTLELLGILPDEAVLIDDQKKNIITAQALGMYGIVFTNVEQVRNKLEKLLAQAK